jgi:hypothetical protein
VGGIVTLIQMREKRRFFIGLEYSSRQGAKNAKFGNLFSFFAAFASLREIILILVAGAHAKFLVLYTSSQETQNSHFIYFLRHPA